MREKMNEPCFQQKTCSCYGCPVMSEIYRVAQNVAILRPSKVERELSDASQQAALERCPEGMSPQTSLVGVRDYGRDLGGRTVHVYMKRLLYKSYG